MDRKLSKEDYQGFYIKLRMKHANHFDQHLIDKGEELSQLFRMIAEARKVKK